MGDERVAEIRDQMTSIRGALRSDMNTIVDNARLTTDWRYYVRQYPWICTALSAALGYFVIPRANGNHAAIDPKLTEMLLKKAEEETKKPASTPVKTIWKDVLLPFVVRQGLTSALSFAESAWIKKAEPSEDVERKGFNRAYKPR